MATQNQQIKKVEKNVIDNVLARVTKFQETGELKLPKDYVVENALKSAHLILSETKDKEGKNVLQSCSTVSIANTLFNMVTQGLSPMKKQCYFIAYGGELQMSRSYQGSIAIARRAGLQHIVANVIYEKDDFVYQINPKTGLTEILKHEQKLENINIAKIRGAYALVTLDDDTTNLTVMTIDQIKKAWLQGYAKGNSGAHKNFTDEMCKKTVISRACKTIINSSTDAYLADEDDEQPKETKTRVPNDANTQELSIEEVEEVVEETTAEVENKEKQQPTEGLASPEF